MTTTTAATPPAPAVFPETMKRLAFVRYLHGLALRQSKEPEPGSAISLLMLHDAIELFLDVAISHHKLQQPKQQGKQTMFDVLFEALETKIGGKKASERRQALS